MSYSIGESDFFKAWLITSRSLMFSIAAHTRYLSLICLLSYSSYKWEPFLTNTSFLYFWEMHLNSFNLMYSPMKLALEQLGIVGVKYTVIILLSSLTRTSSRLSTWSYSKVRGCSGSGICLIWSKISKQSIGSF